jgi:hypothetical protein
MDPLLELRRDDETMASKTCRIAVGAARAK